MPDSPSLHRRSDGADVPELQTRRLRRLAEQKTDEMLERFEDILGCSFSDEDYEALVDDFGAEIEQAVMVAVVKARARGASDAH
jgi:hypothetical protein